MPATATSTKDARRNNWHRTRALAGNWLLLSPSPNDSDATPARARYELPVTNRPIRALAWQRPLLAAWPRAAAADRKAQWLGVHMHTPGPREMERTLNLRGWPVQSPQYCLLCWPA